MIEEHIVMIGADDEIERLKARLALAEAQAEKAKLYDYMQEVAEANGYDCLTDAIAKANRLTAAEAQAAACVVALERIRDEPRNHHSYVGNIRRMADEALDTLPARAAAMVKLVEAAMHAPLIEHDGIVTTCLCCKNNDARSAVLKHKTGCLMLALAALSPEPDAGP